MKHRCIIDKLNARISEDSQEQKRLREIFDKTIKSLRTKDSICSSSRQNSANFASCDQLSKMKQINSNWKERIFWYVRDSINAGSSLHRNASAPRHLVWKKYFYWNIIESERLFFQHNSKNLILKKCLLKIERQRKHLQKVKMPEQLTGKFLANFINIYFFSKFSEVIEVNQQVWTNLTAHYHKL